MMFVGIDIAATSVAMAWMQAEGPPSAAQSFVQTPEGMVMLHQALLAHGEPGGTLVVMEATGSYWVTLATTLHGWGYGVSVINPAQAHHFAKALLKRGKTDAIDAQTLAQLAATLKPAAWSPPAAVHAEVSQRLLHRDNLVDMRTQLRNQLHAVEQLPVVVASIQASIEHVLTTLDEQITALEKEIAVALKMDAEWARVAKRVQSIPGIGPLTTAWLLAVTNNFTLCSSPEALVSYVGLAPQPYQSGTSVARRPHVGHQGQKRLRTALYMAAVAAARWNPRTRPLYERLRAAGKPPKVALCAVARKLIHIAWAVAKKDQMFVAPVTLEDALVAA
jgi:transposase